MEFLAHISEDGREQSVAEHLRGTAALAADFAGVFGAEEQGSYAGLMHDIGKYSAEFQRRIRGADIRVDHATAGAFESAKAGKNFAAFAIAGHHGGIPDYGSRSDTPDDNTMMGRIRRGTAGKLPDYAAYAKEITAPAAQIPEYLREKPDALRDAFFTRMLYSCLVDADFLDTEAFMSGGRDVPAWDMAELNGKLAAFTAGWYPAKTPLNEQRCRILDACRTHGREDAPGLFTLTVPTGGGKTVSSLAFALEHAARQNKRRIIYVVPYTSIIEQTAGEFRKILGAENVLEHHSGVLYEDTGDCATPESIRLAKATENWDMPVVVTTAVQFFESLFSAKPSRCRKLHNIADSVVIFDEAQMLPVPYLVPCVYAIAELTERYRVSAVLCTATQPALDDVFRKFLPVYTPTELCPADIMENPIFRRVTFRREGLLPQEELCGRLNGEQQVLCIVNSRRAAQDVYNGLDGTGGEEKFHLSTLMYPAHRRAVLDTVRARLKAGLPCRVVSTSLIEAGVDVDFPAVYREEAGLDSILQAAGRCNREGKRPAGKCIVTVFRSDWRTPDLFNIPIGAAQTVFGQYEDFSGADAIECYFRELLDLKGEKEQDSKGIMKKTGELAFREIGSRFRLIENDTRTIYIPGEEQEPLFERLRNGERSRALFRALAQYAVSVYPKQFSELMDEGLLELLDTGDAVLRGGETYSPETGLPPKADIGGALFL